MYASNTEVTHRLAKDIWQVKHLKGVTLVSVETKESAHVSISIALAVHTYGLRYGAPDARPE